MAAASVGPSPPAPVSQTASAMRRTSGAALGKGHMWTHIFVHLCSFLQAVNVLQTERNKIWRNLQRLRPLGEAVEKASCGNQEELEPCEFASHRWSDLWLLDQANSFTFEIPSSKVVDARGGPSLKITSRPKKIKSITKRARPSQISRLQKELKRNSEFLFRFEFKISSLLLKKDKKTPKNCMPNNSFNLALLMQILMLTAPPPVPLQLNLQATATCQMMVQTLS